MRPPCAARLHLCPGDTDFQEACGVGCPPRPRRKILPLRLGEVQADTLDCWGHLTGDVNGQ
eukprot:1912568-Alexandrium_andersonii.AAC.1